MDRHLSEWKHSVELIWSAATPDHGEAACLAAEISRASEETILRQAAAQALPILRSASPEDADRSTQDAARRRLGVIREVLHTLTTPKFGKRESAMKLRTPEECHRQLLGLPPAACPAPKSTGPTNAPPNRRIRTPAAARGGSWNCPR